jgi:hypothetical protein
MFSKCSLCACTSSSSPVFVPKRNSSFASFFFFFNFNALTSTIRKRMEMKRISEPTSIISGPLILHFLPPWPGTPQHMQGTATKKNERNRPSCTGQYGTALLACMLLSLFDFFQKSLSIIVLGTSVGAAGLTNKYPVCPRFPICVLREILVKKD